MKASWVQAKQLRRARWRSRRYLLRLDQKGCDLWRDHIHNSGYVIFETVGKTSPPEVVSFVQVVYVLGHAFYLQRERGEVSVEKGDQQPSRKDFKKSPWTMDLLTLHLHWEFSSWLWTGSCVRHGYHGGRGWEGCPFLDPKSGAAFWPMTKLGAQFFNHSVSKDSLFIQCFHAGKLGCPDHQAVLSWERVAPDHRAVALNQQSRSWSVMFPERCGQLRQETQLPLDFSGAGCIACMNTENL